MGDKETETGDIETMSSNEDKQRDDIDAMSLDDIKTMDGPIETMDGPIETMSSSDIQTMSLTNEITDEVNYRKELGATPTPSASHAVDDNDYWSQRDLSNLKSPTVDVEL